MKWFHSLAILTTTMCQVVLAFHKHQALLFTDHPEIVNEFLHRYPDAMVSQNIVEAIVGLPSSQSPNRPLLNTLNIILQQPHTILHQALFKNDCALYRDLKTAYNTSLPHLGVLALLEQTPTFYYKDCRVHLLCQQIQQTSTLDEVVQLVERDLELGNLNHYNVNVLTDFVLSDETHHSWNVNVFEYLIAICGRLDVRLRE